MHFFLLSELNLQNCLPSDKSCSARLSLKFIVMIYGLFIIVGFFRHCWHDLFEYNCYMFTHHVFLHFFFHYWESNLLPIKLAGNPICYASFFYMAFYWTITLTEIVSQSVVIVLKKFLASLGLWCGTWVFHCCFQAFSSCGEWGLFSSCGERASYCSGFSRCGAWVVGCAGFSSRGTQA